MRIPPSDLDTPSHPLYTRIEDDVLGQSRVSRERSAKENYGFVVLHTTEQVSLALSKIREESFGYIRSVVPHFTEEIYVVLTVSL